MAIVQHLGQNVFESAPDQVIYLTESRDTVCPITCNNMVVTEDWAISWATYWKTKLIEPSHWQFYPCYQDTVAVLSRITRVVVSDDGSMVEDTVSSTGEWRIMGFYHNCDLLLEAMVSDAREAKRHNGSRVTISIQEVSDGVTALVEKERLAKLEANREAARRNLIESVHDVHRRFQKGRNREIAERWADALLEHGDDGMCKLSDDELREMASGQHGMKRVLRRKLERIDTARQEV